VWLPGIVGAELCSGKMSTKLRSELESFLADLPFVPTDLNHWIRVGYFRAELQAKGLTVSTPDAHIAQCALDLNAHLLTENAIFSKIATRINLKLSV